MDITVGTFNVKNLFSRFNFEAVLDTLSPGDQGGSGSIKYMVGAGAFYRLRTYRGQLVKGKSKKERDAVATRIRKMDVDVLALQEVEDIDVLKCFNHDDLQEMYPHYVLVEGNDTRLIDVALLSKYPLRRVASWHQLHHPLSAKAPIFGRDLLQVEVTSQDRRDVLFTLFNNHLKSHFGDDDDGGEGRKKNDARRTLQAEAIHAVIKREMAGGAPYIVVGDMNDPVDSVCLSPFTRSDLRLRNALDDPEETRAPKPESDGTMPPTKAWSYRHKRGEYGLFDQIWLSPGLRDAPAGAWIDRRTKHGGDGSDHDPAWVRLRL